jgi:hypothetical protein
LLVAQGNRLIHYFRGNDTLGFPWHHAADLFVPPPATSGTIATIAQIPNGLSVIESNFGDPGNFEAVVRMTPIVSNDGAADFLTHYFFDCTTRSWAGPFLIRADGRPISGVTGAPALIQSRFGHQGNFELVVPQGNRLVHYFRDNDAGGFPWHHVADLPVPAPGTMGGTQVSPTAPPPSR